MTPGPSSGVIRAPNHLGDVVMALPALMECGSDVMVRSWLVPVLEMAGMPGRILPLDPGWAGWRAAVGRLRSGGYRFGTLLTPSFSAAWLFRWGGVGRLRGTGSDGRSLLLADAVARETLRGRHRINQFHLLMGQPERTPPRPHPLMPPGSSVAVWSERLGGDGPVVGLFPGSNAPARRWPPERFGEVGATLSADGVRVVVAGGPGDRELTAAVAHRIPGVVDAGGATDLPGLAALLSVCDVVVTNDTGPMHLAGAVGTPTVTLWGSSDPAEVHPVGARHLRVDGPGLPCRPCLKNHCPRSGPGTLLPDAHEECMKLIDPTHVLDATRALLGEVVQ